MCGECHSLPERADQDVLKWFSHVEGEGRVNGQLTGSLNEWVESRKWKLERDQERAERLYRGRTDTQKYKHA